MRIWSLEMLQRMSQHTTEEVAALKWMELCWQKDVIEQQLQTRRLGSEAREPLEDTLSAINGQLRLIRNTPNEITKSVPSMAVKLHTVHRSRRKVFSSVIKHPLPCRICGKPVSLEAAKTDEDGKAVHEDCYVSKMRFERANQNAKTA